MKWMEVIWEKDGFDSRPSQKPWKISEGKREKFDFWEEGRYEFKMGIASWETEWVSAN